MSAVFEEVLREYSRRAEAYLDTIRTCLPEQRSHTFLYVQLLGYVCSKFMLDPGECDSETISELSAASISKVSRIPRGELAQRDLSMNCAGISSVETKKILLLIALQRSLGIRIDPDLAPVIQTVDDLADVVKRAMQEWNEI